MKRNDNHHKTQCAIVDFCRRYPGAEYIFAIPNGGTRNKIEAVKLRREGVTAGVWDLFLPVPCVSKFGYIFNGLWIEVKVGKDRLSPAQRLWGVKMQSHGYALFVTDTVHSAQSAINTIQSYLRGGYEMTGFTMEGK